MNHLTAPEGRPAVPQGPFATDPRVKDWMTYYDLLRAGRLDAYRGRFIALLDGHILEAGDNEPLLRAKLAAEQGVDGERLVIPFVNNTEYLMCE